MGGQQLLEFTYYDVISHPESVIDTVKTALAAGDTTEEIPLESVDTSEAVPTVGQGFVEDLCQRDPDFRKGGCILLTNGASLETLALDPERSLAVILVDVDRWVRDPNTWQHDLARHN